MPRPGRLDGRTCLIVGGTGGIGLASARRFLEEGARVVAAGQSPEIGRTALEGIAPPGSFREFELELAEGERAVARMFAFALDALGGRLDTKAGRACLFRRRRPSRAAPRAPPAIRQDRPDSGAATLRHRSAGASRNACRGCVRLKQNAFRSAMPNALFVPASAATEAGRGAPMPRLPMAEMVAHAVAVPMTGIMHGEMMPKAVVVRIVMKAVIKSVPV